MNSSAPPLAISDEQRDVRVSAAPCLSLRALIGICVIGLLWRCAVVGCLWYPIAGVAEGYDVLAQNVVQHGVFSFSSNAPFVPTVLRPPLFPLLAAAAFGLFGHTLIAVQAVNMLLGVAASLLLYFAVLRIEPSVAPAVLWMTMLSPFDAAYSGSMWDEPLTAALLVGAFAIPVLVRERWRWLVAGVLVGAVVLSRDLYLLLVPALAALLLCVRAVGLEVRVKAALALVLGAALVILPWTIRNYRAFGKLVPVSSGLAGLNLWVGTWEQYSTWMESHDAMALQAFRNQEDRREYEAAFASDDNHSDIERDRLFLRLAGERIRREPAAVVKRWCMRYWQLWIGTRLSFPLRSGWLAENTRLWLMVKGACFLLNTAILVLAMWGLIRAFLRCSPLLWFALPIMYTALVYVPFHNTETRYSQPVFMFLLVFAAFAMRAPDSAPAGRGIFVIERP